MHRVPGGGSHPPLGVHIRVLKLLISPNARVLPLLQVPKIRLKIGMGPPLHSPYKLLTVTRIVVPPRTLDPSEPNKHWVPPPVSFVRAELTHTVFPSHLLLGCRGTNVKRTLGVIEQCCDTLRTICLCLRPQAGMLYGPLPLSVSALVV